MLRKALITFFSGLSIGLAAQSGSFFISDYNANLYKVHMGSCSTTLVGAGDLIYYDIAMTPSGHLYGIAGGLIFSIDTTDASYTIVGPPTVHGVSLVALNDSILLTERNGDLYAIRTVDASTTLVGTIGYVATGDLTWYFGDLFMSASGQLIRIHSDDNFTSISSVTPVGTFDANMPACEGLTTAIVSGSTSSIVGIHRPDLICFSPVDGTYQTICELTLPFDIPGAASAPPTEPLVFGCFPLHEGISDAPISDAIHISITGEQLHVSIRAGSSPRAATITDLSGRVVRKESLSNTDDQIIDLTGLRTGLYTLEVLSSTTSFVDRFVYTAPR